MVVDFRDVQLLLSCWFFFGGGRGGVELQQGFCVEIFM